jgi:hypothetical protein
MTSEERFWLSNALYGGSFVKNFAMACYCADTANYSMLQPTLHILMEKYPNYSDKELYND